ncbi:MAG TPA: hypothetical protein VNA25_24455 [Phycisphaerae bacterium]|nr:hypothetical protein [Phycisphaerae bacterium]
MASKSSRRKSGSSSSLDDYARLLCDGFAVDEPPEALIAAGEHLRTLGLAEIQWREYVRCADPQDSDFPPKNRHCRGHIYVDDALDEAGHDFRCPECERPVFPGHHRKRRHREMRAAVSAQGVWAYVLQRLQETGDRVKEAATGVYRVELNGQDVTVCVADYCGDEKYLARDWARTNTTCYIVVNSKHADDRFLDEAWVPRISLAQIVCGDVDLKKRLQEVAAAGSPQVLRNASVPVYARGVPPIVEPVVAAQPERLFVVEFDEEVVRVNGETVVNRQAGPRIAVFRILWRRFLEDLLEQIPPERFRTASLKELLNLMEEEEKNRYNDPDTLRRVVNNLQSDIETAVKRKIGLPIGREDIIQTCRITNQAAVDGGYRINPFSVALRPARAR